MRHASALIWDTWNEGRPLVGDLRACTRVTVEPDWALRTEGHNSWLGASGAPRPGVGNWPIDRLPVRWWQRYQGPDVPGGRGAVELEIPQVNVKMVTIDRSIDSDSAQCNIDLLNVLPEHNSPGPARKTPTMFQQPGALTYDFGEHTDAQARWGHVTNEWNRVLTPGALLRTYQGYGGHNKTIAEALDDGNLILTGQWIVDDVTPTSAGNLTLVARDMAALLLDQIATPPLIPKSFYPPRFYRWVTDTRKLVKPVEPPPDPGLTPPPPQEVTEVKRIRYRDSSADRWYGGAGSNANIHGHRGTDSLDGNDLTFALSVGNSHPSRIFCTDYWEFDVGEQINAVWVHPWGGNYEVFISVWEDGRWIGDETIPYDHAPLIGHQPTVVDTGADIRFVSRGGIGWETSARFQLPRVFRADRIRVTFRNHTLSQWGPWFYRCGIREIRAEMHTGGLSGTVTSAGAVPVTPAPVWMDLAVTPDLDGYFCLSDKGQIEEFGTATKYGQPFGAALSATGTSAQSIAPVEDGYYVLAGNGKVFTYGSAAYFNDGDGAGDASGEGIGDAVALCLTHTRLGYWIISRSGQIFSYGDAPAYLPANGRIGAAAAHPLAYGLWLYDEAGPITVRGAAVNYGSPFQTAPFLYASGIAPTPTGLGYFCVEEFGAIQVFGDAINLGATSGFLPPPYPPGLGVPPKEPRVNAIAVGPISGSEVLGYATLAYDGRIFGQMGWYSYGQPIDDSAEIKKPGNYTDYADIIRTLLLWAGFWHQEDNPASDERPKLYANIETTGAYASEPITEDFFVNKPIMDIINALKEVVGYIFWIDDTGAARWESPNWWAAGNFWDDEENSPHTDVIPVIDERVNMTEYSATTSKRNSRSSVQVGTDDPLIGLPDTRSYTHYPTDTFLRGMVVPASMGVPIQVTVAELKTMAQLIGLHIWLSRRTGSLTCMANPAFGINDQVRILERATSEVHVHYVRGVQTTHNLKSGEYTMSVTTHWLGDRDNWVIHVDEGGDVRYLRDPGRDAITEAIHEIERYELSPEAFRSVRSDRSAPHVTADSQAADALAQVNSIDDDEGEDGAAT